MGCNGSKKADAAKDREFKKQAADAKQKTGGPATPVKDGAKPAAAGAPATPGGPAADAAAGGPVTPGPAAPRDGDVYRSPAQGIATPNAPKPGQAAKTEEDAANKIYSTSYTNKRTKEYDLLHRIVEQTQHNFIDVQNNKQQTLDEDAEDRGRAGNKYKALGDSAVGAGGIIALDLPTAGGAPTASTPLASTAEAPAAAEAPSIPEEVLSVVSGDKVSAADVALIAQALDSVTAAFAASLAIQPVGPIVLTFEELQKVEFVSAA